MRSGGIRVGPSGLDRRPGRVYTMWVRSAARRQGGGNRPETSTRRSAYEVLAVTSRALVLEHVRKHHGGVDTATLARATGLHPNTVRFHLDVLTEAGIVTVSSDPTRKPGRPRRLFSTARVPPPAAPATPGTPEQASPDGHTLLAAVLAQHLARISTDPGAAAEAAGRLWTTDSTAEDRTDQPRPGAETIAAVTALLDEIGFAPETVRDSDGWRILLHRCPFHTLAAEHPEIVCRLHLGLLQGAVDRLGHDGGTVHLQPFLAPGLCEAFVPLTALAPPPTTPTAERSPRPPDGSAH